MILYVKHILLQRPTTATLYNYQNFLDELVNTGNPKFRREDTVGDGEINKSVGLHEC